MAALYPSESGRPFQGGRPYGSLKTLGKSSFIWYHTQQFRRQIKKLLSSERDLGKILALAEFAASQAAVTPPESQTTPPPNIDANRVLPPLPPEGGEYLLFYVSPQNVSQEHFLKYKWGSRSLTSSLNWALDCLDDYFFLMQTYRESDENTRWYQAMNSLYTTLQTIRETISIIRECHMALEPIPLEQINSQILQTDKKKQNPDCPDR